MMSKNNLRQLYISSSVLHVFLVSYIAAHSFDEGVVSGKDINGRERMIRVSQLHGSHQSYSAVKAVVKEATAVVIPGWFSSLSHRRVMLSSQRQSASCSCRLPGMFGHWTSKFGRQAALLALGSLACSLSYSQPVLAESKTSMWGTQSGASSRASRQKASAEMHVANGIVAGQVNAARDGLLYDGVSINVTSVGSQNVISTTVIGDGNEVDVDADQDASNSGDVSNDGTINAH